MHAYMEISVWGGGRQKSILLYTCYKVDHPYVNFIVNVVWLWPTTRESLEREGYSKGFFIKLKSMIIIKSMIITIIILKKYD